MPLKNFVLLFVLMFFIGFAVLYQWQDVGKEVFEKVSGEKLDGGWMNAWMILGYVVAVAMGFSAINIRTNPLYEIAHPTKKEKKTVR